MSPLAPISVFPRADSVCVGRDHFHHSPQLLQGLLGFGKLAPFEAFLDQSRDSHAFQHPTHVRRLPPSLTVTALPSSAMKSPLPQEVQVHVVVSAETSSLAEHLGHWSSMTEGFAAPNASVEATALPHFEQKIASSESSCPHAMQSIDRPLSDRATVGHRRHHQRLYPSGLNFKPQGSNRASRGRPTGRPMLSSSPQRAQYGAARAGVAR